jgi:3-hydroxyacyl-[acyl-carrier-protein] dehydratase
MVVPGDQLRLDVEWTREKGRIVQMKGKAFVEGELAAEAEIYASVLDLADLKAARLIPSTWPS